jgi:hypothetical protein
VEHRSIKASLVADCLGSPPAHHPSFPKCQVMMEMRTTSLREGSLSHFSTQVEGFCQQSDAGRMHQRRRNPASKLSATHQWRGEHNRFTFAHATLELDVFGPQSPRSPEARNSRVREGKVYDASDKHWTHHTASSSGNEPIVKLFIEQGWT